jgi:hypothetical protein
MQGRAARPFPSPGALFSFPVCPAFSALFSRRAQNPAEREQNFRFFSFLHEIKSNLQNPSSECCLKDWKYGHFVH